MSYRDIVSYMFDYYMLGCVIAFVFSIGNRDAMIQAAVYGWILGIFQAVVGGQAHHFGYWWYFLNMGADFTIVLCARFLEAKSSYYVARIGVLATVLDLIYFVSAGTQHRLPGFGYFGFSETFVSLQVLSMIVWSDLVLLTANRVRTALPKRIKQWHHRLVHQD